MPTDLDVKLAMNEAREFVGRDVTTIGPSEIGYGISLLKRISSDRENVPDDYEQVGTSLVDTLTAAIANVKDDTELVAIQLLMMEAIMVINGYKVKEA